MKTKFLKFVLPVAFVAFGLVGAFHTNAMEKSADAFSTPGYQKVGATCVDAHITCDDVHSFLCKAPGNVQLYKNIAPNTCPDMLWRSTQ